VFTLRARLAEDVADEGFEFGERSGWVFTVVVHCVVEVLLVSGIYRLV